MLKLWANFFPNFTELAIISNSSDRYLYYHYVFIHLNLFICTSKFSDSSALKFSGKKFFLLFFYCYLKKICPDKRCYENFYHETNEYTHLISILKEKML